MSNANQEKSKEYDEGFQAFLNNNGAKPPYPEKSKEAQDWLKGYKSAKEGQAALQKLRKSKPVATVTFGEKIDIIGGQVHTKNK